MVDSKKNLHMLQIICNFRKNAGSAFNPTAVVGNFRKYHQRLQEDYAHAFAAAETPHPHDLRSSGGMFVRHPHDLRSFYLNEHVVWKDKLLSGKHEIREQIISLTIGTSRTLSSSAYFHPVYENVKRFDYEQLIEIFFFTSFLNTPLVFNHSFRQVFGCGESSSKRFIGHPVFPLADHMVQNFGTILAGDDPRFSPANNTFQKTFLDPKTRKKAGAELRKVVRVLHSWIQFIDSKEKCQGAKDLPLWEVLQKMEQTLSCIKNITGKELDFSTFWLSLFTTFVSGMGLVEPGKHLHQLFFPTKGMASYKHLNKPLGDRINSPSVLEEVENDCSFSVIETIDSNMEMISNEMKWFECRGDLVEVHLCESMANRYLGKKDLFFRGQNIFFLMDGKPMTKPFGSVGTWELIDLDHIQNEKRKYTMSLTKIDQHLVSDGDRSTPCL